MTGQSGDWSYATSSRQRRDDPERPARLLDRRATLRLLFSPSMADRLALLSDRADPDQSLRRLIDLAGPRYLLRSWRKRLPGGKRGEEPPLGPGRDIGGRQALALALQLGMSVTGDQLAELLHRSAEEIGEDLYDARRALDPKLPMPCPEQIPALGRHRDPSLNVNERIGLLRHTADCTSCRTVLERFQQIDAELLDELSRQRAELELQPLPGVSFPSRLVASPAALILVGVLVLILIAGGISFGVSRLTGSRHTPVPLIAAAASPDATAQTDSTRPTGWLILTTTGNGVEAVNLTTAERRTIVPDVGTQAGSVSQSLSPNDQLIASLGPEQESSGSVPITIRRLDGSIVANHDAARVSDITSMLLGWLDNQTLLISEQPSSRVNSPPVPPQVVIEAVDIQNWQSHRFFVGDVGLISISPDGKLALVTDGYEPDWLGNTMELRPVLPGGSGLGPPLATIEHRGIPAIPNGAIWAPDSSRVYFSRIDDTNIQATPDSSTGFTSSTPKRISIIAIDRKGHISTVVAPNSDAAVAPMGISADGRKIFYESQSTEAATAADGQPPAVSIWSAAIDGSHREKLTEIKAIGGPASILTAAWDPSTLLYISYQTSYLAGNQPVTADSNPLAWPVVDAYQGNQQPTPILSLPDIVSYESLAWLPEDTFPRQTAASGGTQPVTGVPAAPESVPGMDDYRIVDASSRVSDDGRYVLLTSLIDHSMEIIDRENATLWRDLDSFVADPSWIRNQDILITADQPSPHSHSWLSLSAAPRQGSFPSYDAAQLDPANLDQGQPGRSYADPVVSPDGLSTAFFVLDRANNNVDLWLAQAGHPARAVDHWSDGTRQSGNLPLLATWVDSHTLLYAMPGSWQDNLPQQPELVRLTIHPDGTFDQKVLLTLPKSGFDHGVAVAGMSLSRNGKRLALRVRHYGHADHNSGVSDAIVVMPTSDLGQRVQIEQAAPGSGLSWSPDGDWLTFGLNNKVEIASANGARLHQVDLPVGTSGASPLWVGSNEIWFTWDNGLQQQLRRVVVR